MTTSTKTAAPAATKTHPYVSNVHDLTANEQAAVAHRKEGQRLRDAAAMAKRALSAAEERVEEMQDDARDGIEVDSSAYAAAKDDIELRTMAVYGADGAVKAHNRKSILTSTDLITTVSPWLSTLLRGHAPTYYGLGKAPTSLPEGIEVPALIITQAQDPKPQGLYGMEQGTLTLSWFRNPLHLSLEEGDIREAFRGHADHGAIRTATRDLGNGVSLDTATVNPTYAPSIPVARGTLPNVGPLTSSTDLRSDVGKVLAPLFGTHIDGERRFKRDPDQTSSLKVTATRTREDDVVETDMTLVSRWVLEKARGDDYSPMWEEFGSTLGNRTLSLLPGLLDEALDGLVGNLLSQGRITKATGRVLSGGHGDDGYDPRAEIEVKVTTAARQPA